LTVPKGDEEVCQMANPRKLRVYKVHEVLQKIPPLEYVQGFRNYWIVTKEKKRCETLYSWTCLPCCRYG